MGPLREKANLCRKSPWTAKGVSIGHGGKRKVYLSGNRASITAGKEDELSFCTSE